MLITTSHVLITTYHVLITTYHVLITTYHVLITTYHVLVTTYYVLVTTYYVLVTNYYVLVINTVKIFNYKLLPIIYLILEPAVCSPFIEERCLLSTIVAAKTTRILHADNIANFIRKSPNIDFIHAVST